MTAEDGKPKLDSETFKKLVKLTGLSMEPLWLSENYSAEKNIDNFHRNMSIKYIQEGEQNLRNQLKRLLNIETIAVYDR